MKKAFAAVFLLLLFVVSFAVVIGISFPMSQLPNSFIVTAIINNKDSELCDMSENDEQYMLIKQVLLNNHSGWTVDFHSYMPLLRLYSDNMNIVMLDGWWVINYEHEYFGWIQLSKEVESNVSKDTICN